MNKKREHINFAPFLFWEKIQIVENQTFQNVPIILINLNFQN